MALAACTRSSFAISVPASRAKTSSPHVTDQKRGSGERSPDPFVLHSRGTGLESSVSRQETLHLAEFALGFRLGCHPSVRHLRRLTEKEEFHLLAQELARLRFDRVESVMIDQDRHLRFPELEALRRDAFVDALPELTRKGR